MDILKTIKILLSITDENSDDIINIYMDMTKQQILNYCNLTTIPTELNYTIVNIVIELYTLNKVEEDKISSISEAGRSVSFDTNYKLNRYDKLIKEKITTLQEISKFKRLYK